MTNIGQTLRDMREARGDGLRQTAGRAGISAAYLCDIELDRRIPSPAVIVRLAAALGVVPQRLLRLRRKVVLQALERRHREEVRRALA